MPIFIQAMQEYSGVCYVKDHCSLEALVTLLFWHSFNFERGVDVQKICKILLPFMSANM